MNQEPTCYPPSDKRLKATKSKMPANHSFCVNPQSSHYDVDFPSLPLKWKKISAQMIMSSGEILNLRLDSRITQSEFYQLVVDYLHHTPENQYITCDHIMIHRDADQKDLYPYGAPLCPVEDEIFHLRVEPYQPPTYSVHFSWEADLMDETSESYIASDLCIYELHPSVHNLFPTEKRIFDDSYAIRRPFQDDNPSVFKIYRLEDIEIKRMHFTKSCDWGYIRIPDSAVAMTKIEDLYAEVTKHTPLSEKLLEKMKQAYLTLISH